MPKKLQTKCKTYFGCPTMILYGFWKNTFCGNRFANIKIYAKFTTNASSATLRPKLGTNTSDATLKLISVRKMIKVIWVWQCFLYAYRFQLFVIFLGWSGRRFCSQQSIWEVAWLSKLCTPCYKGHQIFEGKHQLIWWLWTIDCINESILNFNGHYP